LRWTGIHDIAMTQWPNIPAYMAWVAERPRVQDALRAEGLL